MGRKVCVGFVEAAAGLVGGAALGACQRDVALVLVDCSLWHGRRESGPRFGCGALFPGVPVVVIRGAPDPAEAERALAAGATGYLPRIAEPADLRAMLVQLLSPVQARTPDAEGVAASGAEGGAKYPLRSEEHTSELQSLMRISYAVFCLKK